MTAPTEPRRARRYLPRSLAQTPWIFWSLLAGWAFWNLTSDVCTSRYPGLLVPLMSATVCGAFWAAHVAAIKLAGESNHGVFFNALTGGLINLMVITLVSSLFAFVPPALATQCYTERAKISEVILGMSMARSQINDRVEAEKPASLANIGVGIKLEIAGKVKGGFVTQDGAIVAIGDDPPSVLMLTPTLQDGKVKWQCRGYPERHMPASCRY